MRITRILFAILVWPVLATAAPAEPIGKAVTSLVAMLVDEKAVEYTEARRVHHLPSAEHGRVAAFFTIEGFGGGNNYTYYLALFEPVGAAAKPGRYRLVAYAPVGGKAWRAVDFAAIKMEPGRIVLSTKEYEPNDPMSSPSKPSQAIYRIELGQLLELR